MFGFFKKKKATQEIKPAAQHQQPCEQKAEFGYILSLDGNIINEPSEADLNKVVPTLKANGENFVVLESGKLINGIAFIQATGYDAGENSVYVEAMLPDRASDVSHAYAQTMPVEACFEIMKKFHEGLAPDISNWDHMGDY